MDTTWLTASELAAVLKVSVVSIRRAKETTRTRPPGGPAGAQRRNDSKTGVIDAARRGKARTEDGPA